MLNDLAAAPRRPGRRVILGLAAAAAGAAGLAGAVAVPPYLTSPPTSPAPAAPPRGRFAGKVVLITGATSGIGEATAKAFAAEGAKVSFCGRRVDYGQRVAREIRAAGGTVRYVRVQNGLITWGNASDLGVNLASSPRCSPLITAPNGTLMARDQALHPARTRTSSPA